MMCVLASLRSWTRHLRAIQFSFPPNQSAPFHLGLYSSTTSARPIPFMPFLLHLATIHAASHQTIFIIDHTRIFSSVFSISSHPIPNQTTSLPPRMTYLYNYHSRTTRHHQRGRQLSFRPTPRRQRCTSSLVVLVHPPPPPKQVRSRARASPSWHHAFRTQPASVHFIFHWHTRCSPSMSQSGAPLVPLKWSCISTRLASADAFLLLHPPPCES